MQIDRPSQGQGGARAAQSAMLFTVAHFAGVEQPRGAERGRRPGDQRLARPELSRPGYAQVAVATEGTTRHLPAAHRQVGQRFAYELLAVGTALLQLVLDALQKGIQARRLGPLGL